MEFKIANEFVVGQMVKIPAKVDEKFIDGVCGWADEMRLDLGKVGVVKLVDDDDILVQCPDNDNDNSWYWPKSIFQKPAAQQPWHEVALHLSDFTYSDGSKISWRQIAEMIGVPRTTVSDFLRKTLKGA